MADDEEEQSHRYIEPRILIGMIVSTAFLRRVEPIWDGAYLHANEVATVAHWIWDYYQRYGMAPGRHIEDIYTDHLRAGDINDDQAELIQLILQRASEEYDRSSQFNADYLIDQTRQYFRQRRLELHQERVQQLIDQGKTNEAERLSEEYQALAAELQTGLELGSDESLRRIEEAFKDRAQNVVEFPGALGDLLNPHLIRDGFVAFLAPEKSYKTWTMMEVAMRALKQKANVAFFQAGDMSESQQLKRLCVYLARRPEETHMPKDGTVYKPVKDCIYNQTDQCDLPEREADFGPFEDWEPDQLRDVANGPTFEAIREAMEQHGGEYAPCCNCPQYRDHNWGVPWYTKLTIDGPLEAERAREEADRLFNRYKNRFKLSTHASGTLRPADIKKALDEWEREDGLVPDLVCIDYSDLLAPPTSYEQFRHNQNAVWEQLRGLAQERHCLVLTATQADARSYESNKRLGMGNFSEDKRKLAHVTAMFGLNQGGNGREKGLGLCYINQIVAREGDSTNSGAYVMQALPIGRPFVGSFY